MSLRIPGIILTNDSYIKNFVPERVAEDPTNPIEGRIWFNTVDKKFRSTDGLGKIYDLGSNDYDGMDIDLDIYLSRQSIQSMTYDSSNNPTSINYANGYKTTIEYVVSGNGAGELSKVSYFKNDVLLYYVEYTYDSSSRMSGTTVTNMII